MINCPISMGELFDKISILKIKKEKIVDSAAQEFIDRELQLLLEIKNNQLFAHVDKYHLDQLQEELVQINVEIWDNEDEKRLLDRQKNFGNEFVKVNQKSYRLNDKRAQVKIAINDICNSLIREFKSHNLAGLSD